MDLVEVAHASWQSCSHLFKGAVVYADKPFVSVIKWSLHGGAAALLTTHGAVTIRDFEMPDQPSSLVAGNPAKSLLRLPEPDTVVLLISTHLSRNADRIRSLLLAHPYQTCHIVSSISEPLHIIETTIDESLLGVWSVLDAPTDDHDDTSSYFSTAEIRLKEWMQESADVHGRHRYQGGPFVSVQYQPLSFAIISSDLFLLPLSAGLFPRISPTASSTSAISSRNASQTSTAHEFEEIKMRELASSLSMLLNSLNVKEDIFALGSTSRLVGQSIVSQSVASSRRKSDKTAALILVDRTLDLVSPTMHSDNLLDRIWSVLPRRESSFFDVLVKPQFVCPQMSIGSSGDSIQGPVLSLAHGLDEESLDFIAILMRLAEKEGMVVARRRLVDLLTREVVGASVPKVLGRVNLIQLESMATQLRGEYGAWSARGGISRYLSASVEAAQEGSQSKWDDIVSIEKVLSASLAETMDPAIMVQQLRELLHKFVQDKQLRKDVTSDSSSAPLLSAGVISAKEVLMLALYSYSLLGDSVPILPAHESALQEALFRAMMAANVGAKPRAIQAWVVRVFGQLRQVSQIRAELTYFRHVLCPHQQPAYDPLLVQVARKAVEPRDHSEATSPDAMVDDDWSHISYGGTLKSVMSGFSRFLGAQAKKPHPSQFDNIILVVVGGITFEEAGRVRDELRSRGQTALVGSTNIATTETMMAHVFKSK
ncbi:hypothetical protein BASA83_002013 [Batrachochytrium salamandrivorans]|nr:hypothetical protein BASA83_002013 [Batrachochytrium salamandrivorans]